MEKLKSPEEIIRELRDLSSRMISCGATMEYYGGFDSQITDHGREMVGAGYIAKEWAEKWETENKVKK